MTSNETTDEFIVTQEFLAISKYLEITGKTLTGISRRSSRSFDLSIEGMDDKDFQFTAYFPLAFIAAHDWVSIGHLSDYPEMVLEGDWSGIRDSDEATIWMIFEELLHGEDPS